MKPKSKLRAFLALAGSSLLTITHASAGTYYWDSDGDGTAGFGSAVGTWDALGTGNLWSLSPTGDGLPFGAVANYATTTSDDLYFGTGFNLTSAATTSGDATVTCDSTANLKVGMTVTGTGIPASTTVASITDSTTFELSANATATNTGLTLSASLPFTGAITINGTVNAKSIYCSTNHPAFVAGTNPVINFPAEGRFEHATEGTITLPAMTLTGATTSMTWKAGFIDNLVIENVINNAAKNIFEGTGSFIAIKGGPELGAAGTPIVLNGGGLRLTNGFPYTTMSAFNAAHPITVNPNVSFGLAPFGFAFTLDTTLVLGTGGLYIAGQNASSPMLITAPQTHTGGTFIVSGVAEISDNAQLGDITSPLVFGSGPTGTGEGANGTLRITGTTMTSLGARPLVHTPDKGVAFDIADAANTFTLDQPLTQGNAGFTKSGPGSFIINTTSTYTGATTVNGGKLSYGTALGLPTTTVTVNGADAVLDIGAFNPSVTTVTLTNGSVAGTGTITATSYALNGGAGTNVSVAANLAGAATLTKSAAGTATLSGDNTYTGLTTISGGSLTVEGDHTGGGWSIGTNSAASALTFAAGSTISVSAGSNVSTTAGNGTANAARVIAVSGAVTTSSTSNVTIAGRNTLTINNGGSWNMQGGTLAVSVGNAGYGANLNVNSGGSFTYSGTNTIIVSEATGSSQNGSGALNLRGAFTTTTGFRNTNAGTNATATSNFTFDGGTLKISNDIGAIFESGGQPFNISVAAGGGTIDTNGFNTATSLAISGTGGLTKAGGGTLTLSGTNTYAGNTTVTGGTLFLAAANTNNDSSTVTISGSGVLQLNYAGTDTVDKLFIGATQKAAGEYGKVGSALPIIGIPEITGDGTLTVTTGPTATPFELFMAGYPSLTGNDALPEADPDGDGKNNNFEFAFNGNPLNGSDNGMMAGLVQDASAPAGNELTLVVAVRDGATFANAGSPVVQTATVDGVTYTIEGTLDLVTIPGSAVSHAAGPADTAPLATGLPDLTGSGWEYHTFKLDASEGLGGKGFLRAKAE